MILLDTHVWIWFLDDPAMLSTRARKSIENAVQSGKVFVSSISVWELCMLVARGRLRLNRNVSEWLNDCEMLHFLKFVPVDNAIARISVDLPPPLHGDPADRMIVATAQHLGISVVTKDAKLIDYPHVKTVW